MEPQIRYRTIEEIFFKEPGAIKTSMLQSNNKALNGAILSSVTVSPTGEFTPDFSKSVLGKSTNMEYLSSFIKNYGWVITGTAAVIMLGIIYKRENEDRNNSPTH